MNLKLRRVFTSAGLFCALLTALAFTPAQAAPSATGSQVVSLVAVSASTNAVANITARRASLWAGPGRGFWALGTTPRGEALPVLGSSADHQWWQVNTTLGIAYLWYLDVDVTNAASVPVIDPGPIGVITAGRAIVRTGPGIETPQQGAASRGMQFYILGTRPDGTWIQIRYRFGKGWIKTTLTSVVNTAILGDTAGVARAIVNAGALNVRTGPGFIFKSMGKVKGGTVLPIIGRSKDGLWLQVTSPFGPGWVSITFVFTKDYFGSAPITSGSAAGALTEATFKALGGSVNVRSGPGLAFNSVFSADAGQVFTIKGQSRTGWWYVEGTVGTKVVKGWINKQFGQASGDIAGVPFIP